MRFLLTSNLVVILLLFSSCTSRNQDGSQNTGQAKTALHQTFPFPVEPVDQDGLYKLIQERRGRILLLNIWATWCQPCVEEFPDLIRLARTDTMVEVVGISVDYADEIHSKVIPFLEKMKIPFKVYVAKFANQEDFIGAIDSSWSGAIPATYMYDARGGKRFSHIGLGTYELFEKNIQEIRKN